MKNYLLLIILVFVSSLAVSQTPTENYVKSTSYQIPTLSDNGVATDNKIESITYYDGLGRPKQSIAKQQGGQKQDIVSPIIYDGYGRQSKQYLPYADSNQLPGSANLNFIDQALLLDNINSKYFTKYQEEDWLNIGDVNAYSETFFEQNTLNRPSKQGAPGKYWEVSEQPVANDHTIKYEYESNEEDEVPYYRVIFPTGNTDVPSLLYEGYYAAYELYKTITKDENWLSNQVNINDHTIEEFKDKQGRVILKRTYNNGAPHDTQYVYDDYGNLTYVLSPKGSDQILSQNSYNSFNYDIFQGRYGASITPDQARRGSGVSTSGSVMVSSYKPSLSEPQEFKIEFNVSFSQSTPLKTGAITQLMYYVPDVVLGTIQANGGEYTIGIKDQTLYFSGSGTFTSINQSLSVVLPTNAISTIALEDLCYQYHYDHRNRLIEKKIPGKDWESIVYDKLDRPVLTQDALLQENNQWLFTKYDALGRVAYTGLTNSTSTRTSMQSNLDTQSTLYETSGSASIDNINTFYSNNAYPQSIAELHTLNYYDSYNTALTTVASNPQTVMGQTVSTETRSLPTGSKIRVLVDTGDHWVTTVNYYDDKARPIYSATHNSYLNTTDVIETELDFMGKVLQTKAYHTKNGTTIEVEDTFAYDHASRLISQEQQINNQASETIVNNTYDELGQLIKKGVGGSLQNPLQNVDYRYNIRGWLKQINDVANLNNDLFSFQLNYANNASAQSDPLYNGNIADALWKTANDNTLYSYNYRYDALNRITDAVFNGGGIDDRYNLAGVRYDKNGNHKGFTRKGPIVQNPDGNISSHFGVMDQLTNMTYKGNQLLSVADRAAATVGFIDDLNINDDFEYDANGNMIIDRNKGITSIAYNHLNLPTEVIFDNNQNKKITYIYDAAGSKHKKEVNDNGSITNTMYAGNYIYEDNALKFFSHPEGYIEPNGGGFDYIYQYKDHLGNIRLSYNRGDFESYINDGFYQEYDDWEYQGGPQSGSIELEEGRLKVNVKEAYNGVLFPLDGTFSVGDQVHINLELDKATTNRIRISINEFNANNVSVHWKTIDGNAQSGAISFTHTVHSGTKIRLKIDKSFTNTWQSTHFYIDNVEASSGALEIVEENNYYPFGLKHKGYNNVVNGTDHPYGYNGFEEQNEFNGTLGWIDYDARNYDPALGRWFNIDPLSETSRRYSPYTYALDNPIYFIDPDGMQATDWFKDSEGNIAYDENINSQQDLDDAGIEGEYIADSFVGIDQDQGVHSFNEDGTVSRSSQDEIGEDDTVIAVTSSIGEMTEETSPSKGEQFTKEAGAAVVASQGDSPAPGPADLLAVGMLINAVKNLIIPQEAEGYHNLEFAAEHTKRSGSKKRTNDKHTKKRPGSPGKKQQPRKRGKKWKPNPNKRSFFIPMLDEDY